MILHGLCYDTGVSILNSYMVFCNFQKRLTEIVRKSHTSPIKIFETDTVLKVFTLLLLCTPTLSFALGLGDINLKSNLGEPLAASVAITDIDGTPDASCFSVIDNSDTPAFKKASIALKNVSGSYQLVITTHDVIAEPVINLQVSINCDPNYLKREYVLLLDPVALASTEPVTATEQKTATDNQPVAAEKPQRTKIKSQVQGAVNTEPSGENLSSNKRERKVSIKKKSSSDQKLMEAYTGKPSANTTLEPARGAQTTKTLTTTDNPRLIISGKDASQTGESRMPNLSLRLETQLDLARVDTDVPLSNTDALDELTVMTNRLAHLEKHIISLQEQNKKLQTHAEKTKLSGILPEHLANWLPSLPIGLGIIAILSAVLWLRRKIVIKRLLNEEAEWFNADKMGSQGKQAEENSLNSDAVIFDEVGATLKLDSDELPNTSQASFFTYPNAYTVSDNDLSESVLDHAEVFLAHDRPAMAIQLLQNHLSDAPAESPEIWLKLITLLATEGSEEEYEHAVSACKKFFNIKLPNFKEATTSDNSTIEDYPHILVRLQEVWGSEFAVEFLNDLIYNRQSQPREGFGRNTFSELFLLKQIAVASHASNKLNAKIDKNQANTVGSAAVVAEINQTEQDYSQDYGVEIKVDASESAEPTNEKTEDTDKLTAESFFNAPDAIEDDFDLSFQKDPSSEIKTTEPFAAPTLELDMLYGSEEPVGNMDNALTLPEPNQNTKSIEQEAAGKLNAEEIDFSNFLDEINIEASPDEIKADDASHLPELPREIEFQIDNAPLPDDTLNAAEEQVHADATPQTKAQLDMIEWELPTLEPKAEPASTSKSASKKKPST